MSLKALLGNGVPTDWTPQRSRTEAKPAPVAAPAPTVDTTAPPRITPLRDAAATARSDRPSLNRPVRGDSELGPLRSILPARPRPVESPERPTPLRSLLQAVPTLIDPLPGDALPVDPVPATPVEPAEPAPVEPAPVEPSAVPEQDTRPSVRETTGSAKEGLPPGDDNVVGHDPALLRRRDR